MVIVWKTIIHLRSTKCNLKIFVLDCDYGLGIITKEKPKKLLEYTPAEIKNLTYKDLDCNRKNLLNLKNPNFLYKFLNSL